MRVVKGPKALSRFLEREKAKGKTIGLVPTMGYLHEGHLSLIRRARRENSIVVVSIFVNPAQFGPKEDYKKYPRDLGSDIRLARSAGCDIIFYPAARQVYPEGYKTYVYVRDLSYLMCGVRRPAHFEGVSTVCAKLFNIVRPDMAYFGQKDYQQAMIIKRMVEDLNMGFEVKTLPIVREKDGLAMSSRNTYLKPQERKDAPVLYRALWEAAEMVRSGEKSTPKIKDAMRRMILKKAGIKIDYITVADPLTLKEQKNTISQDSVLIALAAWVGKTRLIDNILVRSS